MLRRKVLGLTHARPPTRLCPGVPIPRISSPSANPTHFRVQAHCPLPLRRAIRRCRVSPIVRVASCPSASWVGTYQSSAWRGIFGIPHGAKLAGEGEERVWPRTCSTRGGGEAKHTRPTAFAMIVKAEQTPVLLLGPQGSARHACTATATAVHAARYVRRKAHSPTRPDPTRPSVLSSVLSSRTAGMSKLAALLVKLQAKAEARRRAEGGDGRSSSSSASSSAASSDSEEQVSREEGSGGDASVYGSLAYWDARYETGEIGAASGKKGELSNEWCVARQPTLSLCSAVLCLRHVRGGTALVAMACTQMPLHRRPCSG